MSKNHRKFEEVYLAERVLRGLRAAGLEVFPLGIKSKLPRDKGFLLHDYGDPDFGQWLDEWGNWGIRARACDLIVDIDPRHGGEQSLESLVWELDLDLSAFPFTVTGSGGKHIFMSKPSAGRWRWHLKGYPGIDFQSLGRYVVAPGSIHPDTGRPYTFHAPGGPLIIPPAPAGLLERLQKPPRAEEAGEPGEVTNAQLSTLLTALDANAYGAGGEHHDEWLDIAMASHHATNGAGFDEWQAWCQGDERYGAEASERNAYRWDSFDSGRPDSITYKTLLRAVARVDKNLVAGLRLRGEAAREFAEVLDLEDTDDDLPTGNEPLGWMLDLEDTQYAIGNRPAPTVEGGA